jgi:ADP-glucose type glycogen/starch synthase
MTAIDVSGDSINDELVLLGGDVRELEEASFFGRWVAALGIKTSSDLLARINRLVREAQDKELNATELKELSLLAMRTIRALPEPSRFSAGAAKIVHLFDTIMGEDPYNDFCHAYEKTAAWSQVLLQAGKALTQLRQLGYSLSNDSLLPASPHFLLQHSLLTAQAWSRSMETLAQLESLEDLARTLYDFNATEISIRTAYAKLPVELRAYLEDCDQLAQKIHDKAQDTTLFQNPRRLHGIQNQQAETLIEQVKSHLERQLSEERSLLTLYLLRDTLAEDSISRKTLKSLSALLPETVQSSLKEQGFFSTTMQLSARQRLLEATLTACSERGHGDLRTAFDPLKAGSTPVARHLLSTKRLESALPGKPLERPIRATYIAAECLGVARQGGLAEAVYGMAKGVADSHPENKIRLIIPKYSIIPEDMKARMKRVPKLDVLGVDGRVIKVWKAHKEGIRFYFIDGGEKDLFKIASSDPKRAPSIYGPNDQTVAERFIFFSRAAAALSLRLAHKTDVIHLHDWHSAAVAPLLKRMDPQYNSLTPALVYTFHNNNWAAQGAYHSPNKRDLLWTYDIPFKKPNLMATAISMADAVSTVSETFAQEAQTKHLGFGLQKDVTHAALQGKLSGIVNGSNPGVWDPAKNRQLESWIDPETGKSIDLRFSSKDDILKAKKAIRTQLGKYLQKYFPNVKIDLQRPIILYVGRFDAWQKGLDMFDPAMEEALAQGAQVICMGSQEDDRAKGILDSLEKKYDDGVWFIRDFKNAEGRYDIQQGNSDRPGIGSLVRAIADYMLIPSEFEPCGLVQFEGHSNGVPTIACGTGGLADTIIESGDDWNGFLFQRLAKWQSKAQKDEVRSTVRKALEHLDTLDVTDKQEMASRLMEQAKAVGWTNDNPEAVTAIDQYRLVYAQAVGRRSNAGTLFLETGLGSASAC